jgi:single-strand DNA-binding protein
MQKVQLLGHIGKDAETRMTSNGNEVTSFSLATNYRAGNEEQTTWWNVQIWGERGKKLAPHLNKGKQVYVSGDIKGPRTYVDKNGNTQVAPLDVRLDHFEFTSGGGRSESSHSSQNSVGEFAGAAQGMGSSQSYEEDNVPF